MQNISSPNKISPQSIALLRRQLIPLFQQHGVVRAALFGSFARGEQNANSDFDLLVEFEKGKSLLDLVGLKLAIEHKIERKADLATDAALHPRLRNQILSEAIPLYEKKRNAISR